MPAQPMAPMQAPAHDPGSDNLRGVVLMALGFAFFAAGDVQSKMLTDSFNPLQIVWMRSLGLFLGVVYLLASRGSHLLRTRNPRLQVARGLAAAGSATCFIFAVRHVPLADAVAVSFVAPFILTVFGALLLREPVGLRRWLAVLIGFAGMLIVIRPGFGVFHPAILLVVAAAALFAARQVLSRWMAGSDAPTTTIAYTAITVTSVMLLTQPFVWQTPGGWQQWALIVGLAGSAAIGEVLVIRALDIAQAVVLAPLHYTLIIWGTLYGFLVFGDLPDGWTLTGCAIIMLSGLYTLHRERLAAKRQSAG